MKVAVVGVTGLVGNVMCDVLTESQINVDAFLPVASARSIGKRIAFAGKQYSVIGIEDAIRQQPDVAIFSAGGSTSLEWAPRFAEAGIRVVDNSSAWRMDPTKKLVVPEVNANVLTDQDLIIANPNCSTIQMIMALAPLHQAYTIKRLVISTYQSFTGTGVPAVAQYEAEKNGQAPDHPAYPHPIFENCLPHCDVFLDNDYTKEEMKLVHETRKILGVPDLRITATAVRVPVHGGHSESVNIEFEHDFQVDQVRSLLTEMPGVKVLDDPSNNVYPTPRQAKNRNEVFVGRIRRDDSIRHGLNMWIVADNLRKGAATNAVQIAQYLLDRQWI